ncbi:DNA-deoxyinosine glycosylase [Campylobacter sp. VicNov18]|uniref:DNA-deoxyinosine glycosylase n=1 Tax=Campylobacter bilis TaxID=2691918 RepID=UPI0013243580|nr:DNA-deoxyinosine glycosylase [Campylobacter bilis]MPV63127.1 DNA-deoxyinosine glycosylase [Campylobacter hepaticus]MBM0636626.1 DNA-deoxyinosine glycosylase [Campylobacter bilis]MCC8277471.1 DNA-deoxyinosine glycosylase [Campylobacter bilis]MCC8298676.1 DNA-deoxyinosine glycosylase [Campylobacter bilis]MCC8300380.1 DNA-deoxyinosine glycosylase [Campylobacter bilis]
MSDFLTHPFKPFFDKDSKILILGSFPSVKSRQDGFYYQHPRNRFWPLLEILFDVKLDNIFKQQSFLKEKNIALWDVLASCKIKKSNDKTISYAKANDLNLIFDQAKIKSIFTTGQSAYKFFQKFHPNLKATPLPSTSPANLNFSFEKLLQSYKTLKDSLEKY